MKSAEFLADRLLRSRDLLASTLSDFSDAELLVRPTPGANHPAWQVGHLIASECRMIAAVAPEVCPKVPGGFAERFTKDTAASDDAAGFAGKTELLETFARVREATAKWVGSLTAEQLDQPGPTRVQALAPTIGHMAALIAEHTAMHVGQLQVVRRKLGKPVLF